jgi:hypothetical protein
MTRYPTRTDIGRLRYWLPPLQAPTYRAEIIASEVATQTI